MPGTIRSGGLAVATHQRQSNSSRAERASDRAATRCVRKRHSRRASLAQTLPNFVLHLLLLLYGSRSAEDGLPEKPELHGSWRRDVAHAIVSPGATFSQHVNERVRFGGRRNHTILCESLDSLDSDPLVR